MLRDIGGTLLIQHKMVWRVELSDKPEILWERPELERLYTRLEIEYELRERHSALDRKLGLISRTAQTLLELLQNKRSPCASSGISCADSHRDLPDAVRHVHKGALKLVNPLAFFQTPDGTSTN